MKITDIKLFYKFIIVVSIPILLVVLSFYFLIIPEVENDLLKSKKGELVHLIDNSISIFEGYYQKAQSGQLPDSLARERARQTIKTLRYAGKEYFFVCDLETRLVAHPFRSDDQVGKDQSGYQDADGKRVYVEFVNICKKNGEGFVPYNHLKKGETKPRQKISYVKLFKPWGWIVGTGVYLDTLEKQLEEIRADMYSKMIYILLGIIILGALAGYYIANVSSKFIKEIVRKLELISNGDITQRIGFNFKDEIGLIGKAIDKFLDSIHYFVKEIIENENTLNNSSVQLAHISEEMSSKMENVKELSSSVAAASEQMAANVTNMASTAEEMSINAENVANGANEMNENTNNVATAVEEMSMSINDVTQNAQEAMAIAVKAKEMSDSATGTMETLGEAANEIGKVTEVIKRIAEQTNLLALNATIEAASAGEAGKGFAVVANEIKELANQSAKAAEDIANKINGVQTNTKDAVKVIGDVSEIINKINSSVEVITKAVEQQSQAAADIANSITLSQSTIGNIVANIQQVAQGSADLAKNSSEAAEATNDVASNIHLVNESTAETAEEAQKVKDSSQELALIASSLDGIVKKFKLN